MRKLALVASVVLAAGLTLAVAAALANRGNGNHGNNLGAKLNGYQETPAESTPGHGTLRLRIVGGDTIHYVLHYEGFEPAEGSTTAAHIHFGQFGVGGGVIAFLCGGGDKPTCTDGQGTFEGDIDAADIVGPSVQGIQSGEMAEVIRAVRKGVTYANVHTTLNGAGLIRGQIRGGHGHGGGGR